MKRENKHATPVITTSNGYVLDCRKGEHIAPNDNAYCQCGRFRRTDKGVQHWYAAKNPTLNTDAL